MTIDEKRTIARLATILKKRYGDDFSGHDWYHLERVWKMAKQLAKEERVDQFVLEMAALLHDVDDSKIKTEGEAEFSRTEALLQEIHIDADVRDKLFEIIRTVSFHGGFTVK